MAQFNNLVSALARTFSIELQEDDNHVSLFLDDFLYDFYYDATTEKLLVIAMIGDLGEAPSGGNQALLFKKLLKAQFCFGETTGFTFGLADNDEFVALQALWDIAPMSEQDFLTLMEKFVQTVRLWSHKLEAELRDMPSASALEEGPRSMGQLWA